MDWLIKAKKVSKCKVCSGSGYVPLNDETMALTDDLAIEIGCEVCEGKGKITEKVNLPLESLKEMINGLK